MIFDRGPQQIIFLGGWFLPPSRGEGVGPGAAPALRSPLRLGPRRRRAPGSMANTFSSGSFFNGCFLHRPKPTQAKTVPHNLEVVPCSLLKGRSKPWNAQLERTFSLQKTDTLGYHKSFSTIWFERAECPLRPVFQLPPPLAPPPRCGGNHSLRPAGDTPLRSRPPKRQRSVSPGQGPGAARPPPAGAPPFLLMTFDGPAAPRSPRSR